MAWRCMLCCLFFACTLDVDPPEGALVCRASSECPPGWVCSGERCWKVPPRDAGVDATSDVGPTVDVGPDVGRDAGADTNPTSDAGPDTSPPSDAGTDAGPFDAGPDVPLPELGEYCAELVGCARGLRCTTWPELFHDLCRDTCGESIDCPMGGACYLGAACSLACDPLTNAGCPDDSYCTVVASGEGPPPGPGVPTGAEVPWGVTDCYHHSDEPAALNEECAEHWDCEHGLSCFGDRCRPWCRTTADCESPAECVAHERGVVGPTSSPEFGQCVAR